jgi:hypothetical protein
MCVFCDFNIECKVKGKAIPVTGRGGPQCCERSRIPHFLNYLFTDGDEGQSYDPAALYPQEDSWYSFLLDASFKNIDFFKISVNVMSIWV